MSGLRDTHAVHATGGVGGKMSTILSISCGEPGCDRSFGSESARASHLQYQHQTGIVDPLGYPCRVSTCSASFGTAANRDEHMRETHQAGPSRAERLDAALDARAPRPAGTVLTTPAVPAKPSAGEVDTSDDLSEDAGSIPAPRSDDSGTAPDGEGEPEMATKFLCQEPGCDRQFDSQQAVTMHVTRTHRGLGGAPRGSKRKKAARKAPPRVQSNGYRRGDPAKNLVVLKLDRLQLEGLLELVMDAGGSVDLSDPADLRREAGRMQLLATLQEASAT